jgi:alkanesulfonate monooxygenase SsuD/methylene tetrahydromethanopterin reductase-like flavin-dependent oxidoreductase (luciferase family)
LGIRSIVTEDPNEVEAELAHFAEQSQLPLDRARQMEIAGTPAEVADSLLPYVDVGFDWFVLMERKPLADALAVDQAGVHCCMTPQP